MRLLLRLTLSSVVVLSLCCATALVIGHQQPLPARVRILHLTDCVMPCWIGIEVGKTTMEEAEQRLLTAYKNNPLRIVSREPGKSVSYEITMQDAGDVQLMVTFFRSPVDFITIDVNNLPVWDRLIAGDLIAIYGSPAGFRRDFPADFIIFGTPNDQFVIPVVLLTPKTLEPKTRLSIDEPTRSFAFRRDPRGSFGIWNIKELSLWRGFSSLDTHYPIISVP